MAASPQWYLASSGLTKLVQPYCRFATAAMQTIPSTNCTQGRAKTEVLSGCESVPINAPPYIRLRLRRSRPVIGVNSGIHGTCGPGITASGLERRYRIGHL